MHPVPCSQCRLRPDDKAQCPASLRRGCELRDLHTLEKSYHGITDADGKPTRLGTLAADTLQGLKDAFNRMEPVTTSDGTAPTGNVFPHRVNPVLFKSADIASVVTNSARTCTAYRCVGPGWKPVMAAACR